MGASRRHAPPDRRGGGGSARARRALGCRAARGLPRRDRRARRRAALLPPHVDEAQGDGVPIALKDVISTKGVETTAGSRILAGYVPVFDATVAARCKDAGLPLLGKTNTDEFAMGSSTENSAWGPVAQPVGPDARAGRVGRRFGRGGHRRARTLGARLRHRRLDQAALGALRQRRPATHVRHGLALRRRRLRLEPRSGRAGREDRARRRAPLLDRRRAATPRLDDRRSCPHGRASRGRRAARACASASRASSTSTGASSRACARRSSGRSTLPRSSARRWGSASCRARSTTACPATT